MYGPTIERDDEPVELAFHEGRLHDEDPILLADGELDDSCSQRNATATIGEGLTNAWDSAKDMLKLFQESAQQTNWKQ